MKKRKVVGNKDVCVAELARKTSIASPVTKDAIPRSETVSEANDFLSKSMDAMPKEHEMMKGKE